MSLHVTFLHVYTSMALVQFWKVSFQSVANMLESSVSGPSAIYIPFGTKQRLCQPLSLLPIVGFQIYVYFVIIILLCDSELLFIEEPKTIQNVTV